MVGRFGKSCFAIALLSSMLCGPLVEVGWGQPRLTISQLYVRLRATRNKIAPEGDLKTQIAEIEKRAVAAFQTGKTGEVRRLVAEGMTLLAGKPWNSLEDYRNSLVLRTDTSVADLSRPLYARLEQIYLPDYKAKGEVTLRVAVTERSGSGRQIRPGEAVKDFGRLSGVASDLVDEPFLFQVDVSDAGEGAWLLTGEVYDGETMIHQVWTPIHLVAGIDAKRIELEEALNSIQGHQSAKASVRYPFDFARRVNLGEMSVSSYDFAAEIREAEAIAGQLRRGDDPLYQATGALKRHYHFEEAGAIMPYRMYVPASYDGAREFPLVVGLHGLGGNESVFFRRDNGLLQKLAEKHGYIVATPLGYNRTTGYGQMRAPTRDPVRRRQAQWSEADVLNVLELVMKEYRIDKDRVYLTGHSMGGNGTWHLGGKYPHLWAGLAPIASGQGATRAQLEKMKDLPVLLTHGDQDYVASVEASRRAARLMEELGMEHVYNEVPNGSHSSVVVPAWEKMFPFFDEHRRHR